MPQLEIIRNILPSHTVSRSGLPTVNGWHLRASKNHPHPTESHHGNNYGCLFPVHVAGCSPVMPNGALTCQSEARRRAPSARPPALRFAFRLADESCSSEHDNSRDECCHAGIRQDFIENSGHCTLSPRRLPYSRRQFKATPTPWRKGEILRVRAVKCS